MKKTKIVCTIGPASQSTRILTQMVENGMAIARLNFSHGTYENHALLIKNIRSVSAKLKQPIQILQDLQGPKIRIAALKKPVSVKTGHQIIIGQDINIDANIVTYIKPGHRIFIQDGLIQLVVTRIVKNKIHCTAVNGGKILPHKGVNLPDTKLELSSLTQKDLKDLKWGLRKGVDLVAISFVRSAQDISVLKKEINKLKGKKKAPKIVAKIEKPEALKNIDSIIKAVNMVMVARGDLGVEIPEEKVPKAQALIVKKCNKANKPVIVATQMLESMVNNPRPTRAEVEDIADAVLEGADYTMLSEETAFGKYPVEVVKEMNKVIREERRK